MKAGKADFGYLWQGKQAEVLVCDLVSIITSNNGAILAPDGKSSRLNDAKAVEAVQYLYDTIHTTKISPTDVLSWDEEPSRQPFTAGKGAVPAQLVLCLFDLAGRQGFGRWSARSASRRLPHFPGGKSAACLGGYQYGVNAATKNREAAIDFLTWMSSPATQLRFALQLGIAPTRPGRVRGSAARQGAAVHEGAEVGVHRRHAAAGDAEIRAGHAGDPVRRLQGAGRRQRQGRARRRRRQRIDGIVKA